ncbi:ABC transporter ATP-binding protein [Nocardioides ferulae]|uniref:ABC transporter ATP-binding protein n=1 Tax=Nocardioides ferulae TaxID=2340821 RepID=UPI000EAC7089|nr:ABC transporter ATP-binding protein [Nocardioides ferulae]
MTPQRAGADADPARGRALLELAGVTKRFGDLVANDDVSLSVGAGEVVAMLGENGAGKSTLMKIAYGLVRPDAGELRVDGRPVQLGSPRDAMRAGIGMVTQEFSLVETMTVSENVALSAVGLGRVDAAANRRRVMAAMERLGVQIEPERLVATLSIGERQRVEIVKALFHDCRVLILDEPTAVLTPQDVRSLFETIARLRTDGLGVLFVSHKLREVAEISDRVVVLRRGRMVGDRPTASVDEAELAALMMGGAASAAAAPAGPSQSRAGAVADPVGGAVGLGVETRPTAGPAEARPEPVLRLTDLGVSTGRRALLSGISLTVGAGEIVGIAGISGNGQTELVDVLAGVRPASSGTVHVAGRDLTRADVATRLAAGLGRLTEDRRGSLVPQMSVEHNLVLEDLPRFTSRGLLDRGAVRRHAEQLIERFDIRARPGDPVATLSGGNMQKVLLARSLVREPRVLVVAQPTRGLDVGSYAYVHEQLAALRDRGAGVLVVSEDLDELRGLCDRVAVLFRGRIVGELPIAEASSERLGLMMTGVEVAT